MTNKKLTDEERKAKQAEYKRIWRKNNPDKMKALASSPKRKEKVREYSRKYRLKNIEKVRENSKRWKQEHPEQAKAHTELYRKRHPDRVLARSKKWNKANPYKVKAAYEKYYELNKERKVKFQKKWVEENREKVQMSSKRYYELLKLAGGRPTKAMKTTILLEQEGLCFYCNGILEKGWHCDHKIPISKYGKTVRENLCVACRRCHLKKGSEMTSEEYMDYLKWKKDRSGG